MARAQQKFLKHVKLPPGPFRRGLNLWPPFVGAGVRVTRVSPDYREVDVTLKLGLAIVDAADNLVAKVEKTLYIRRHDASRAGGRRTPTPRSGAARA